jgi:hypothetical protein
MPPRVAGNTGDAPSGHPRQRFRAKSVTAFTVAGKANPYAIAMKCGH